MLEDTWSETTKHSASRTLPSFLSYTTPAIHALHGIANLLSRVGKISIDLALTCYGTAIAEVRKVKTLLRGSSYVRERRDAIRTVLLLLALLLLVIATPAAFFWARHKRARQQRTRRDMAIALAAVAKTTCSSAIPRTWRCRACGQKKPHALLPDLGALQQHQQRRRVSTLRHHQSQHLESTVETAANSAASNNRNSSSSEPVSTRTLSSLLAMPPTPPKKERQAVTALAAAFVKRRLGTEFSCGLCGHGLPVDSWAALPLVNVSVQGAFRGRAVDFVHPDGGGNGSRRNSGAGASSSFGNCFGREEFVIFLICIGQVARRPDRLPGCSSISNGAIVTEYKEDGASTVVSSAFATSQRTNDRQLRGGEVAISYTAYKRYEDFVTLRDVLLTREAGTNAEVVPGLRRLLELPPPSFFARFDAEFVTKRRKELDAFMKRLASQKHLWYSQVVQLWLMADPPLVRMR